MVKKRHTLKDVLHTPNVVNCLLSITKLDNAGGTVEFGGGKCVLKDSTQRIIGTGRKDNKPFVLDTRAELKSED
jgi:hypothetical protein